MAIVSRKTSVVVCAAEGILLTLLLTTLACDMGKGSSGEIPHDKVFLAVQGTLVNQEKKVYPTPPLPTDIASLEAVLEVNSGSADLSVGVEDPPSDYFSNGPGPGIRKILITPNSREPLQGRIWYVQVSCPFDTEADFSLTVRKGSPVKGLYLLDEQGVLAPQESEDIPVEVPPEAGVLEIDLETLEGDADLFLGRTPGDEDYWATNPGKGHDLVVATDTSYAPLTPGTWYLHLETWDEESEYRLTVRYY